ncbi:MAG: SGNH/GDSL hydrolase family protein [Bacteroidaceae bacterium]|nr:SGNH/GDSL hydrolase family protein [Bacteroidaceae bacterium]
MKRLIFSIVAFFCLSSLVLAGCKKKISILGDSYSTFVGYVTPKTNLCFYRPKSKFHNDVHRVEDTWWYLFCSSEEYELEINNSYSGSTICNTGYGKNDYSDRSFVTRMNNLGNPDIIFIFGGTNDCWASAPLGNFVYGKWTNKDLYYFRPAFSFLLNSLKKRHPKAMIVNLCNSDLEEDYCQSMQEICRFYNIINVRLKDIDKQEKHPSIKGMKQIHDQILKVVKSQ